ncbi:hypothetical protein VOLCADRAFT_89786 [Volvox carteri f. nagariensis]|uniref:Arsenosugar biosynthesis radical SAM protein ArsS-like C-terminal domain-containing protein n=1 Tax=Volvox carteri f. nagariensis TaxID=3068 RepID=D8TSM6_VOLCA|nr:uncharacterized protein VOLCADRAFT_89786 [Volvox carteri f. nagariensis]EFJ49515.1 hypothetical protein VOLCADRAFT_89786 [Volvox carteri f. nagariensis]|eukprot:XP_002949496.1 hypothetical protein VOLCADRAFT_89786 [Volvox carteri f. nagariensis]
MLRFQGRRGASAAGVGTTPTGDGTSLTTSGRSSLVPTTLRDMEQDLELQRHLAALAAAGQQALTREERLKRQRSLDALGAPSFYATCQSQGVTPLKRSPARILQLNIGLYCNQACSHCHVESSPRRTAEQASRETVDRVLALLRDTAPNSPRRESSPSSSASSSSSLAAIGTLDITGGAPELNENFRYLVSQAAPLGVEIIDRCNLTVLLEPGQEDLADFLAAHKARRGTSREAAGPRGVPLTPPSHPQVRVVASLPCYSEGNVDQQRGRGVFERSIAGLRLLNAAGYGVEGSGLQLDLVYNPGGAFLAPSQAKLEAAYKSELGSTYGISFNRLLAINNMPIKRFADWLVQRGQLQAYMQLLLSNFNPAAGEALMCRQVVPEEGRDRGRAEAKACRDTISVRWDGTLYDCDFNQQLDLAIQQKQQQQPSHDEARGVSSRPLSIWDIQSLDELTGKGIHCDNHCYGCTAGSGSSCQGAVA